jgi:hypothetical protein
MIRTLIAILFISMCIYFIIEKGESVIHVDNLISECIEDDNKYHDRSAYSTDGVCDFTNRRNWSYSSRIWEEQKTQSKLDWVIWLFGLASLITIISIISSKPWTKFKLPVIPWHMPKAQLKKIGEGIKKYW